MNPIYLDFQATTPLLPGVLESMLPFFKDNFGNPSSESHVFGMKARAAIETARKHVAQLVDAEPSQVYFTSGSTEANAIAILGFARQLQRKPKSETPNNQRKIPHFISSTTEHKSVLENLNHLLENNEISLTLIKPDKEGKITTDELLQWIQPETRLITLMKANNEIGTVLDIEDMHKTVRQKVDHPVLFHSDATQALKTLAFSFKHSGLDFMSLSGHKIGGPKGIGAIIVKNQKALCPILFGGSQERALRPGTQNVPGIAGFGAAAKIAKENRDQTAETCSEQRSCFIRILREKNIAFEINGPAIDDSSTESRDLNTKNRLPQNLNLSFTGVTSDLLATSLPGLAFSAGSACTTGSIDGSHVLKGIGLSPTEIKSSVRIGFDPYLSIEQVKMAANLMGDQVLAFQHE